MLAVVALAGCRTPPPAAAKPAPPPGPVVSVIGRVRHVNEAERHVLLECAGLPSIGQEATVVRGERTVARLRITGPERPPFIAADILSGTPRRGDSVRVEKQPGAAAPSEGVP